MPRTMTAEREAYWRKTVEHLGRAPEQLLAELDAERAESQRLRSIMAALAGALKEATSWLQLHDEGMKSREHAIRLYGSGAIPKTVERLRSKLLEIAALHPEPAAE